MFLDDFIVTGDNLLETLPRWDYSFEISFQLWIEEYAGGNQYGFSELLRFTATEKHCCSSGDRIPAIFANKNGYIHVTSQVGENGNFNRNFRIPVKTWVKFVLKQYRENGQVI